MPKFHHHPDGLIYIRGEAGVYCAPVALFADDCAELDLPAYEGVSGAVRERQYEIDRHVLFTADSQYAAPLPWPDGEAYVAAHGDFLARQAIRAELPPE